MDGRSVILVSVLRASLCWKVLKSLGVEFSHKRLPDFHVADETELSLHLVSEMHFSVCVTFMVFSDSNVLRVRNTLCLNVEQRPPGVRRATLLQAVIASNAINLSSVVAHNVT